MATGGIDTASEYRACGTFPLAVPHLRYQFRRAFESGKNGRYWPKAAELSDVTVRQLSGEHRTCCQPSRNGSLSPR